MGKIRERATADAARDEDDHASRGPRAAGDLDPLAKAGLRVLVVDDDPDAAEVVAFVLDLRGHSVEVAHCANEAQRKARARCPHVAILDLSLEGIDGFALARLFRADPLLTTVRLVALTGWGSPRDRARAKAAGFDAHLVKPASVEAIEDVLRPSR